MKVLVSEKLSEHKYKTPEGYLICTDAILARTGKQSYTKDELFQDGDNTEVNVDRPYDEVMNAKTIASFENKPITFDHPDEDVNVGNYKDYAIGYVRDVHQGKTDKGEDVILGNLVITDQDAINAIEQGDHTDLSCGYDCDIRDDGSGNYSQTNIRGNHLALCEQGRAGIAHIVDSKVKDEMNYSEEMKAVRNALRHIVVDNKSEMKQLIQDLINNKPMNYSLEVRRLKRAIDELIKWSDNRQEGIDTIWAIAKENRIVDSKVEDAAIGGHYKNNRGENFFICSYGSGFSIFKADGEYLDGSKHLSLDGVKQRILYYNLTKVKDSAKDSIMKDESEDWTEMLIKLAVKNGKNSSGDYEYDGDADVNQVRRVLKKLGYKDNGYVKNPKSYLHKLHYYFTDSEILEDAGWKTTKMASGIIHELGNMRIIEEENEKGDTQYRIGGTNGQVFSSLEEAKKAIRRKHLDEIEDNMNDTKDSKEMTMSDAIKMLNIVDIYKKVRDSYIVVRNKSKYEDAARKLGLTIEKDSKSLRIYGDRYKLKQLQNQFDNDEEISYIVAKDSISKVDLKRGIDIAEDKYGYFDFSQLKEEIEKTTKHQFSTRELYEALKQNGLLNAYISRLFGNIKDEDLTKDGKLWSTLTRKAKH